MCEKAIRASAIAESLCKELHGANVAVTKVASLANLENGCLVFVKKVQQAYADTLNAFPEALAICHPDYDKRLNCAYIISDNPRLDFIRAHRKFFMPQRETEIHPTACVEPGAVLGAGIYVGAFSYIGANVIIGDGTEILEHVTITGRVRIGQNCRILEGACIGCESMGCERDENGTPIEMPQIGGVRIGDRVKVGAGAKIARGTLDDTVIGNDVKLDVNVYLAHNDQVGDNCIFTASVVLSGSVKVGQGSYFAPGALVLNGIGIGPDAYIGMGSVVLRNVKPNTKVFGNPARGIDF